jgi:hypothetical protein
MAQVYYISDGDHVLHSDSSNSANGLYISINGLDEVPVDPSSLLTFRVLAHLPLLLHPGPRDVMVLSLGGGITTGSVATLPALQPLSDGPGILLTVSSEMAP